MEEVNNENLNARSSSGQNIVETKNVQKEAANKASPSQTAIPAATGKDTKD